MTEKTSTKLFLILVVGALAVMGARPAWSADVYGSSKTLSYIFQESYLGEESDRFSLYEYADLHAEKFGVNGLALHFAGWGRYDAFDTEDEDQEQPGDADLTYAYLEWTGLENAVNAKLGRQFIASGPTAELMDAADLWVEPLKGLTIQGFGGIPVYTKIGERDGDMGWGGRLAYGYGRYFELGAAYSNFLEEFRVDRDQVGGDFRSFPIDQIDLLGHVYFDRIAEEIYDATGMLNLYPVKDLRLTGSFTHLLPTSFLGHMSYFSVFSAETIDIAEGEASYLILNRVRILGGYAGYTYDEADNATRPGGGLELLWGALRQNVFGARYYRLDREDNGYNELRGYVYQDFLDKAHVAVNADVYQLDNEMYGQDQALSGDLSLGWMFTPHLGVQATGLYQATPYYDADYRGLLKITYNLDRWL